MEAVAEGYDDDVRNKVSSRKPGHGTESNYDENAVVDAIEQVRDAIFTVGKAAGHVAAKQMIAAGVEDGDPYDMGNKMFDEIVNRFKSEVGKVAASKADTDVGKHDYTKKQHDLKPTSTSGRLMRHDQDMG